MRKAQRSQAFTGSRNQVANGEGGLIAPARRPKPWAAKNKNEKHTAPGREGEKSGARHVGLNANHTSQEKVEPTHGELSQRKLKKPGCISNY